MENLLILLSGCSFPLGSAVIKTKKAISHEIAYLVYENGGDERDRTADPLLARQVLSQLSYAPI